MDSLGFVVIHITFIILVFILLYVLKIRNRKQIHNAFMAMIIALLAWTFGTIGLEYGYRIFNITSILMVDISYIGIILTPLTVLYLGLVFAYTNVSLNWRFLPLAIVPTTSIILLFTNNTHHLFYRVIEYGTLTQAASLGDYFPIHTLFSYGCILVGMGYLVLFSVKNSGFFSKQSMFILAGVTISFTFNFLLTIQVIRVAFYTNLVAFFFAMLFVSFAIFKFNFLNIAPIALQRVVDHMSDAFVVLDDKNLMIDFNKTFTDIFGKLLPTIRRNDNFFEQLGQVPGSNIDVESMTVKSKQAIETERTIVFEQNFVTQTFNRYFMVEITPISTHHRFLGTLILLKDITEQKKSLEALQAHQQILLEQERLASLGQLIGGIAHNLKTPIMSLSGGIEALSDLVDEYHDAIGDVQITTQDHREIAAEMRTW
ncbi:MAG TPA: histidine kinase N-terminal 7TM domain-containing protein, partial [Clostridia bacterium]